MSLSTLFAVCALIGSVVMLTAAQARAYAVAALVASGIEVGIALGFVSLAVAGLPLGVLLGAVLAVTGVLAFMRVGSKSAVAAATVVALVGLLQVVRGLDLL